MIHLMLLILFHLLLKYLSQSILRMVSVYCYPTVLRSYHYSQISLSMILILVQDNSLNFAYNKDLLIKETWAPVFINIIVGFLFAIHLTKHFSPISHATFSLTCCDKLELQKHDWQILNRLCYF